MNRAQIYACGFALVIGAMLLLPPAIVERAFYGTVAALMVLAFLPMTGLVVVLVVLGLVRFALAIAIGIMRRRVCARRGHDG